MDAAPASQLVADELTVFAPEDCTEATGLQALTNEVRRAICDGRRNLTIDLSRVKRMNARLLATVLLLVRESRRAGSRIRLASVSDEFRNWARTFNVLSPLERRGVIV